MVSEASKSGKTKQIVFLVVIVLILAVAVAGFIVKGKKTGNRIIAKGDHAPEFRLPSLNGQQVSLSDFRGKIVMVHFWATWCPPCVDEIPNLAKFSRDLAGSNFEMLAVSVDEGGAGAVAPFLQKNGLSMTVLLDPDRAVANRYGTRMFPETYILDRQGIVRYKVIGAGDWTDPAAVQALRELIASK